jgi:hypothetical protein
MTGQTTLAIDIGCMHIKATVVDEQVELVTESVPSTPYPHAHEEVAALTVPPQPLELFGRQWEPDSVNG